MLTLQTNVNESTKEFFRRNNIRYSIKNVQNENNIKLWSENIILLLLVHTN